jgi:hypothetical protein
MGFIFKYNGNVLKQKYILQIANYQQLKSLLKTLAQ